MFGNSGLFAMLHSNAHHPGPLTHNVLDSGKILPVRRKLFLEKHPVSVQLRYP
jgi:hypothetical protein